MRRLEAGSRLVVASHNEGKVREINDLVRPFGVAVVPAGELNLPEPEETGETFAENAVLKAVAATTASGLAALSDDSGLAVDALDGAPGIHSARWAGPDRDFALAMRNLEEKLQAVGATSPDARRAHFTCALCIAWPDGETHVLNGRVDGRVVWPPRGAKGFGYDRMFVPNGHDISFGEMDPEEKHTISHRAVAFRQLIAAVFADEQD